VTIFGDLYTAIRANTVALQQNTAALQRVQQEELRMDQDIQAAVSVAQAIADGESALHADLAALVAAIGSAPSLSAEDRSALEAAVAQLQGTVTSLKADAQTAVDATPTPAPGP
jgi:hypothetical protein